MSDSLRDAKATLDLCEQGYFADTPMLVRGFVRDLFSQLEQTTAERDRWQQVAEDTELERMTTRAERDRLRAALNQVGTCYDCGRMVFPIQVNLLDVMAAMRELGG